MIKEPLGLSFHNSEDIPKEYTNTNNVVFFDADKLSFPLTVRPWKNGDKMKTIRDERIKKDQ